MAGVGELVLNADGEVELAETTGEVHLATADPQTCCCAAEGACYVKPKNCLTGVDHPLFVVPCTDHYYVFALAGILDCWYVDTDFTQYTSVPTGYSALPSPDVGAQFEDCETCRVEEGGGECEDCYNDWTGDPTQSVYANGDVMVVTWKSYNYDDAHENCSGADGSGSAVLEFDSTSGTFKGTGPYGEEMEWTGMGFYSLCNRCLWQGTIDINANQTFNAYCAGTIYAATSEERYDCDGTYGTHQCFDAPPPGSDWRNVRVDTSISVYPTSGYCWDATAGGGSGAWSTGTPDEMGCCT